MPNWDSDSDDNPGHRERDQQWGRSRDVNEQDGISIEENIYGPPGGVAQVATAISGLQETNTIDLSKGEV